MPLFEMVKYHKHTYPEDITCNTEEIAGHFDVTEIHPSMAYSLHTEYCYAKRKWDSCILEELHEIRTANKNGVPQLWTSEKWASEFAQFIIKITSNLCFPKVIEIHPPFSDYSPYIEGFVRTYGVFEDVIRSKYPDTHILIENRSGSTYRGGKFIVSTKDQLMELCNCIERMNLDLKIALDIPQLYTAHHVDQSKTHLVTSLLNDMIEIRQHIKGVHLWGKRLSDKGRLIAHCGDFHSYFNDDMQLISDFQAAMFTLFDDDICRNLVLEVNSGTSDLVSIIDDLRVAGFSYV